MERVYEIASRWFDGTWQSASREIIGTYEDAAREASSEARRLDAKYGNEQQWNVYLLNLDGEAYFELFHGRLS